MSGVVLIFTHPQDVHAHAVADHLVDLGVGVHRVDTPHVLAHGLTTWIDQNGLRGELAGLDLADVTCVWHRRPSEFTQVTPVAAVELRAALGGVLATLPHLNHPADMARANLKPFQLALAAAYHLRVPETVVTTHLDIAQKLAERHDDLVVVKPMHAGPHSGHKARGQALVPTAEVTAARRDGWRLPVHLTQQQIDKVADVRVTVVDGEMYAVEIESSMLDWRADPSPTYRVVTVPEQVAHSIMGVMGHLRLRYAAWDFAVESTLGWWFLELNPNGQWLWLEQATGIPISLAVARALARPRP